MPGVMPKRTGGHGAKKTAVKSPPFVTEQLNASVYFFFFAGFVGSDSSARRRSSPTLASFWRE